MPSPLNANDFWGTVNARWAASTEIPPTETRITQAYFIRKQINRELDTIIRSTTTGPIADLVASWRASEASPIPRGLTPLLLMMLATTTPAEISARIGWMNRHGIAAPLSVYVQGDPRDHRRCRIMIEESTPKIGIPEYWEWPTYATHRRAYATYVKALAAALGLPALKQGYGAEREISAAYPVESTRKERYNMLTWAELRARYSVIDWTALFTAWGLAESELPRYMYNVTSHSYLRHVQSCLRSWGPERWQGWLALLVAQWCAGLSPHGPLRAAWFAYNRRHLQGMLADDTAEELRFAAVRTLMPNTLGQIWARRFCTPKLRTDIETMIRHIQNAAAAALRETAWMSPQTREAAIRKLRAMDVQICWPDPWVIPELGCALNRDDLTENLLSLSALGAERQFRMLRGGDCRKPTGDGWGRPVYEVNAFYYPEENRFLLPAAILRPPFYDPTKSLPWNYGAIGATIGHEFCHAFDADGRRNDERGDERDWWTEHDDREYKRRAAAVVRLYESEEYRGMEVDGRLTLVENIADLGGLEFALAGLRRALGRPATKAEHREFFTSFAISWRSKDRQKRAAELLATDPHAPPRIRVNHAVRQFEEWYAAFDVEPTAEGFIPPARRIHFFGAQQR